MSPIFALGDIHGQHAALCRALDWIAADPAAGAPVVFLGDYVDRGPASREVIDTLIQARDEGHPWTFLMGNHDRYMRNFLTGQGTGGFEPLPWLAPNIGGRETLASYGVDVDPRRLDADIRTDALDAVPQSHLAFLRDLEVLHMTDRYIFVHAGIRPGVPLSMQSEDDLLWIRDAFLQDPRDHGRLVVHGHTAGIYPSYHGNRLNLDGGAGFGNPLVPALLTEDGIYTLNAVGRARL